jgi:histidinol dehydrogenase
MRISPLSHDTLDAAIERLRPAAARSEEIERVVAQIVGDVRTRRDEAVVDYSRQLDWPQAEASGLRVPAEELERAFAGMDDDLREAFEVARANLSWFHFHERPQDWDEEGRYGQRLGIRHLPVGRAGLYVPGGLGAYSSTVLMNAVPAQVAGVGSIFICTPPDREGRVNQSVLAAARFVGIEEVYRVGGAQAVAAMAYGTVTIPRADVICGPGNAYVMEAKRQVYGVVGIDGLAGPSEVVIVAGEQAEPAWIAADLLAQEEHGMGASAVLLAPSEGFCRRVAGAVASLRAQAGAQDHAADPDEHLDAFYPDSAEPFAELAREFVNAYAPEHLEVHLAEAREFATGVTSAGAIFLGDLTPTAYGDYVAGSNHVLPTGGSAHFSSPLSVDTFIKKSSLVELTPGAVRHLAPHLGRLAASEGFEYHRLSGQLRLREDAPADEGLPGDGAPSG